MQQVDIKGFQDVLETSRSVVILLPENPSFDVVAGALALHLSLSLSDREVAVVCPSEMIVEFNRLVGVDKVVEVLGNKNLVIRIENYQAENIEKVSYDIKNGEFSLLVISKPKFSPPAKEQVKLEYSGSAADLVLVVGAESRSSLGKFSESSELFSDSLPAQAGKKVAIVGRVSVAEFPGAIELVNPQGSSVSEVAFQLIEALGLPLDTDIAKNLFDGLQRGTDNFQNNVTAETFAIASRLLRNGAQVGVGASGLRSGQQNVKQDEDLAASASFREPTLK